MAPNGLNQENSGTGKNEHKPKLRRTEHAIRHSYIIKTQVYHIILKYQVKMHVPVKEEACFDKKALLIARVSRNSERTETKMQHTANILT